MPELPEVETVVTGLRQAGLAGRHIMSVKVNWRRSIIPDTPAALRRKLIGRCIETVKRRAKYICMRLDDGNRLLVHLRMTGRLLIQDGAPVADRHDRVILGLDDGRALRLHDTRKFARVYLVAGPDAPPLCRLGPEPLAAKFTAECLAAILHCHRAIKPLLLDQHRIAGIGNIYADESLWDAGIHPARHADSLSGDEIRRLHRAIRRVLRRAIRAGGTSLGQGHTNFTGATQQWGANAANLRVYRRHDQPCPRCKHPIERIVFAQRATHYCAECQPLSCKPGRRGE